MITHRVALLAAAAVVLGGIVATGSDPDPVTGTGRSAASVSATGPATGHSGSPAVPGTAGPLTVAFHGRPAPGGVSAAEAARTWHYKNVRVTFCALDKKPYWGGPKPGASCATGYAGIAGEVAYNGRTVWGQRIDCRHKAISTVKITVDWCGYWNNGGRGGGVRYMDLGLNGTLRSHAATRTYWIRVDAYRDGKVALRGGRSRR